jgi:hypothetical protein
MLQIEKSSRLKSGEYGCHSTGVQNSAKICWVVLVMLASAEFAGRCIFHQDMASGHRLPHAVLLFADIGVESFTGRNWLSSA